MDEDPMIQQAAARIVTDAIRAAGIDPQKAGDDPVLRAAVLKWVRGEMDDDEFADVCRTMRLMKPWLAIGEAGSPG